MNESGEGVKLSAHTPNPARRRKKQAKNMHRNLARLVFPSLYRECIHTVPSPLTQSQGGYQIMARYSRKPFK